MSGQLRGCFRFVESCLDYRSYAYTIDTRISPSQRATIYRYLRTLGQSVEERMGVDYVRGPWGFFVIPPHGHPHLRISFYFDTPDREFNEVLTLICAAFEAQISVID